MKKTVLFLCFACISLVGWGQAVNITISGIRSSKGSLRLQFFTSAQNFDDGRPHTVRTVSKSGMKNGTISVSFSDLPTGTLGIALLDDENGNKKMDYGLFLPAEGFGFSDYYHEGMSHPTFDQFDFTLKKETKDIKIKIRYL